jgi:YfiH family protein
VIAREATRDRPDADIIVSDRPGLALAVQAADCVPLLVADRRTGAVAAAHAGWRGMAAGVPTAAVAALVRELDSRASDLVAAIGPSIGACCYEVGSEVRDAFRASFPGGEWTPWFLQRPMTSSDNPSMPRVARVKRPDRWFFDAWTSTRAQLERAGVPADQIFGAELCTASHPDAFCSYRRDGAPAGRLAGAIMAGLPRRRP